MIDVVELFAGVGGFRLGLERASSLFNTVLANQWEPDAKHQYAYDCYSSHWDNCINEDVHNILDRIPRFDMLVLGLPCQPFSVARTSNHQLGMDDLNKGQLWWVTYSILKEHRPKYMILENVDRLLKSPTKQRGRDFGIMLKCLTDLGYKVYWRVINAAEYGLAQRRRRTFIFATTEDIPNILSLAFPYTSKCNSLVPLDRRYYLPSTISDTYNDFKAEFGNTGCCIEGKIVTADVVPVCNIEPITLRQIRLNEEQPDLFLTDKQIERFKYLKGTKHIPRVKPNGEPYIYSEGAMPMPDIIDRPGRTMLTSEGSVNRTTHVIEDISGRLRFLHPIECERLNGFDDDWTVNIPK